MKAAAPAKHTTQATKDSNKANAAAATANYQKLGKDDTDPPRIFAGYNHRCLGGIDAIKDRKLLPTGTLQQPNAPFMPPIHSSTAANRHL
ncbi:hypothetical protein CQZ76_02045 [Anaplasma marginale]|nr:hypothetical protein CQZ76_02045 [Anaplasma marginale]